MREATRFWWRLGWISFGGPAGQIALMHEELVEQRRWVGHDTFLHALQFCMVLPGPEAQQLATYLGWWMHGTRGGLIAGTLFVLPAAAILLGLSIVYVLWGSTPGVTGILRGLQPAVVALIANALINMGRRVLRNTPSVAIALAAAAALGIGNAPFPLVIALAGTLGFLMPRPTPRTDPATPQHEDRALKTSPRSDWIRVVRILGLGLLLWLAPMGLLALLLGSNHVVVEEGLFFGKAALVTFGGAYAVLPYVAQRAVDHVHWLGSDSMLHGLALAETTPGPLVIVLQFVGFLGGWNHPGALPRFVSAALGAAVALWSTFLPSFVWIFLGAPCVQRWRSMPRLQGVLDAIGAAVIGVLASLAFWMGSRTLFPGNRIDLLAVVLTLAAFCGLRLFKWPTGWVVAGCALIGWIAQVLR
ncbi:MAG: chromate efflux transporter [Verrucomicrobia bacterium]|nr:chromate efflux transporter [Verrucomicrobiota bacterium]